MFVKKQAMEKRVEILNRARDHMEDYLDPIKCSIYEPEKTILFSLKVL